MFRYRKHKKEKIKKDAKPSKELKKQVFERDGNICFYCGSNEDLNVDHVMPLSLGGKSELNNLVVSCIECNRIAGDHPFRRKDQKKLFIQNVFAPQ